MSDSDTQMLRWMPIVLAVVICGLLFAFRNELFNLVAPQEDIVLSSQDDRVVTMHSVLPKDAIPAIDDPQFITANTADGQYGNSELIIGVAINGDARAYSIPLLSSHEIVNDTVGGQPVAVTW